MARDNDFRQIKFSLNGRTVVRPLLDVTRLAIPETVMLCSLCHGHAQYEQRWCDAPPGPGACTMCRGGQFVYRETGKPIPRSVRDQIEHANTDLVRVNAWPTEYRVAVDYGGRLFHADDR